MAHISDSAISSLSASSASSASATALASNPVSVPNPAAGNAPAAKDLDRFIQSLAGDSAASGSAKATPATPQTTTLKTTDTYSDPLRDLQIERFQKLMAREEEERKKLDELFAAATKPLVPLYTGAAADNAVAVLERNVENVLNDAKGMNADEVPGYAAVKAFAEKNRGNFSEAQANQWFKEFNEGPNRKGGFGNSKSDLANLGKLIGAWQSEIDVALKPQTEAKAQAQAEFNYRKGYRDSDNAVLNQMMQQQTLQSLAAMQPKPQQLKLSNGEDEVSINA